jgi:hypothetical protein
MGFNWVFKGLGQFYKRKLSKMYGIVSELIQSYLPVFTAVAVDFLKKKLTLFRTLYVGGER